MTYEELWQDRERLREAIHAVVSEAEASDKHPHQASFDCGWLTDQILARLREGTA